MVVTDITEYNKRKVLVQLDGHLIYPIYKGEVERYHVIVGEELGTEAYHELVEVVLPKRLKIRAMELLRKRSYTRMELGRKLLMGHYPEDMVKDALDYVESYRYLDDVRYADEYIRTYVDSRSKQRIVQGLLAKGVNKETILQAWEEYLAENEPVDEESQIRALLHKKQFDSNLAERKDVARMINFLYRRGYSADSIRRCLRWDEE